MDKKDNLGIYASGLEANSIIRKTAKENLDSYLPHSIFTKQFFNGIDLEKREKKYWTDLIINVKFNDSLFTMRDGEKKVLRTTRELRRDFYNNGFDFNKKHYVRLTRGAGKARVGECLFIAEEYSDKAFKILNFGLPVYEGDKVDLASWEAYRSLIMSESIGEFKVNNNEIIICDDVDGDIIKDYYLVTSQEGELLKTEKKLIEIQNTVTDGYAIGDKELFIRSKFGDKSMVLLRNYFYKGTIWNCNLQKWFKDNNIDKITDIFGVEHDTKKVKMITFKTSWKFTKFSYLFNTPEGAYKYWLNNRCEFNVVKYSKEGNSHHTSYQHINSLPFNKKEIAELLQPTLDRVENIKNNPDILAQEVSGTNNLVGSLLEVNEDFVKTDLFRQILKDKIASIKNDTLCGRIELGKSNCGYHTMICNPMEVLKTVCGISFKDLTLKENEVYCKKYNDNEELTGFRSPHIFLGNVFKCKNVVSKDINDYFNFDNSVVVVNSWDVDVMGLLEGADFDGDTVMLTNNEIINEVARRDFLPIPFANVEGEKREYHLTNEDLVILDDNSHNSWIGKICNKAQLLNSLLNHYNTINFTKYNEQIIQDLGTLDIMSRIAIDSAKKTFSLNNNRIFLDLNNRKYYIKDEDGNKLLPQFFKKISDSDRFERNFETYETPMDYVYKKMSHIAYRPKRGDKIKKVSELLVKPVGECNIANIEILKASFNRYKRCLRYSQINFKDNSSSKSKYNKRIREELIENIKTINLNLNDVYEFLKEATPLEYNILYEIEKLRPMIIKLFS